VATLETMNDANIRTSPSLDLSTLAAATLCTQAAIPHNLPCNPMHPGTNLSLLRPLRANHLGEIDVFDDYPVPTDQRMWDGLCRRTVTPPACRPTSATAHCPAPLRMEPSPYHLPTISLPSPYHLPTISRLLAAPRIRAESEGPSPPREGRGCGVAARPGQSRTVQVNKPPLPNLTRTRTRTRTQVLRARRQPRHFRRGRAAPCAQAGHVKAHGAQHEPARAHGARGDTPPHQPPPAHGGRARSSPTRPLSLGRRVGGEARHRGRGAQP
jgi:hypothetical protein